MEIVTVDTNYVNYLFEVDYRVSWNKTRRPYVGVVFEIGDNKYFAPMTSSKKGKKLADNPIAENVTFLPIDNCKHGGINFNNMIPVIDGVYTTADTIKKTSDLPSVAKYKSLLQIQRFFILQNQSKIKQKASVLYKRKMKGQLKKNDFDVTCDFTMLEEGARQYAFAMKSGQPIISLLNKYDLTPEQYNKFRDKKPEANRNEIEKMIRADIIFSSSNKYNPKVKERLIAEVEVSKNKLVKNQQNNTQEKNNNQQLVTAKPRKKDTDYNCR